MHPGSCECKSVRYQLIGKPLTCYTCHCTDCQTSSGSAFSMSMIVKLDDLEIVEGEPAVNILDYGETEVRRHHCPKCGTGLWYSADEYPGIAALKPGTFDDTAWFTPIAHLWVRSAQPWVVLDEDTPRYEKQPELSELIKLWVRRKRN